MSGRINYKIKIANFLKNKVWKKFKAKSIYNVLNEVDVRVIALFMIVFVVVLSLIFGNYNKNQNMEEQKKFYGKTFVTETYPIFKDVVIVGDSYSHQLAKELGYDTTIYSSPGLTVSELAYCFNSAKKNQKKYVVVFIGPNDFRYSIAPEVFHDELKKQIEMFNEDSKVILCEYLPSLYTEELEKNKEVKYKITDYDQEMRSIADILDNVYYFDLGDMRGNSKYYRYNIDETDKIHFNYEFYIEFINKLYNFIMSIG